MSESAIQKFKARYTFARKVGGKWNAFLRVDHQSFCIVQQDTYSSAQWYRRQAAIALFRLTQQNSTP